MIIIKGTASEKERKRAELQKHYEGMDMKVIGEILGFFRDNPGQDFETNERMEYLWAMLMCIDHEYVSGYEMAGLNANCEPIYQRVGVPGLTEAGRAYLEVIVSKAFESQDQ